MTQILNIMQKIKDILFRLQRIPSDVYHKLKSKRLHNTNPSIIASNCFGTFIYHDNGLKFNSPTINLFFKPDDFLKLVRNLHGFMQSDVYQVDTGGGYPVGKIIYNGEEVLIYFMHYHSFAEAEIKWNERKSRINWDNIYILHLVDKLSLEHARDFDALPYEHKLLLADCNPTGSKNVVTDKHLRNNNFKSGDMFKHKCYFHPKRYIDDVDYISWLNNE